MPNMKDDGYMIWRPGQSLAWFQIVHRSSQTVEYLYQPTQEEIMEACRRFGLDTIEVLDIVNMIDKKEAHVAGMMVDVERFLEAQGE